MNITLNCDNCGARVLLDDTPTVTVTRKGNYRFFHVICSCGKEYKFSTMNINLTRDFRADNVKKGGRKNA